ncbi:MAG: O-antigen ligase family protein [Burkholderiales bacterium]|uniref:O-antigen ligase family protein n=1 Tax=Roseateles sp. TaxID=1971397 RepID=UPI000FBA6CC1|nr:MAG: O-antigen ligase family protein [Burkholderiales bacterium]
MGSPPAAPARSNPLDLILLALLLGLVLALPLVPNGALGTLATYDMCRALQGMMLLAAACLAWVRREPTHCNLGLCILLSVLAWLSCSTAAVPVIAWRDAVWTAALLLLVPTLGRLLRDAKIRGHLLFAIVVGQFAYVLLASAMLMYGLLVEHLIAPWHGFPGFENPRFFNHSQTLTIPLLLAFSLRPQAARPVRHLAAVAVVLHVFLIGVFLARATVVGLVIAVVIVAFTLREQRLLKTMLIHAALGAAVYVIGCKLLPLWLDIPEMPIFRDPNERGSIEARLYLWQIAVQNLREHPWLGVGPMHFAHQVNGEAAHPHNVYLQIASEYGLPFALIAIAAVLMWLRRRFRLLRQDAGAEDTLLAMGCLTAIVSALIDGLFSGNFVMPISQTWMVLCAALLMALQAPRADQTGVELPAWLARIPSGCVALGLIVNLALMAGELSQPEVHLGTGHSLRPEGNNPRFWLDGWF